MTDNTLTPRMQRRLARQIIGSPDGCEHRDVKQARECAGWQCVACRATATDEAIRQLAAVELGITAPDPLAGARYVCREHFEPVNARGKGCGRCSADIRAARLRRRPPRQERQEQP